MKCEKCDDTRHVKRGDAWVPCGCLRERRWRQSCEKWGVPPGHLDFDVRTILAQCSSEARTFFLGVVQSVKVKKIAEGLVFIHGKKMARRFTSVLLREMAKRGAEFRVYTVTELVDREFDRPRTDEPFEVRTALLRLGVESPHKYNQRVVESFLMERAARRSLTMFTSHSPPSRLTRTYGDRVIDMWQGGLCVEL